MSFYLAFALFGEMIFLATCSAHFAVCKTVSFSWAMFTSTAITWFLISTVIEMFLVLWFHVTLFLFMREFHLVDIILLRRLIHGLDLCLRNFVTFHDIDAFSQG